MSGIAACCIGLKPGSDLRSKVTKEQCYLPCGLPLNNSMGAYAYGKIVGSLWISQLAKDHPAVYFASISPGGVVTGIYDNASFPLGCMMRNFSCAFKCIGALHSVETGATRYVDAALDASFPGQFPSGAVVASPCGPCHVGAAGRPLTDESQLCCLARASYLADAALQADAAAAVRELAKAPTAAAMGRS